MSREGEPSRAHNTIAPGDVVICVENNLRTEEPISRPLKKGRAYRVEALIEKSDEAHLTLNDHGEVHGPYPANQFTKMAVADWHFRSVFTAALSNRLSPLSPATAQCASDLRSDYGKFLREVEEILTSPVSGGNFPFICYYPNGKVKMASCSHATGIGSGLLRGQYGNRFKRGVPMWVHLIHAYHICRLCAVAIERGFELPEDPRQSLGLGPDR